jgi:RimJ/RimL family protein N-acetyltransferase
MAVSPQQLQMTSIASDRLVLEPVMAAHAAAMFPLLADEELYEFTGGKPPADISEVRRWFTALESRTSPEGDELWFTWIAIIADPETAIGYVQATVTGSDADIAWLIGLPWQGAGYGREAAQALVNWLGQRGISRVYAHIHPDHQASQGIARAAGLHPTGAASDGEVVWSSNPSP